MKIRKKDVRKSMFENYNESEDFGLSDHFEELVPCSDKLMKNFNLTNFYLIS
jgi:hypothetical protein